jgi:hypothetical protein
MAWCALGSMSAADWNEIKKLCKQMQDMIDERFKNLDTGAIKLIRERISALSSAVAAFETEQATQNARLDIIEGIYPNREITTSEVLNMYNKGDIDG